MQYNFKGILLCKIRSGHPTEVTGFSEKQTQSPLLPASDELGVCSGRRRHTGKGGIGNLQGHTARLFRTPELLRLCLGPISLLHTFSPAHTHKKSRADLYRGYQISKKLSLSYFSNVSYQNGLKRKVSKERGGERGGGARQRGANMGGDKQREELSLRREGHSWRSQTLLHTVSSRDCPLSKQATERGEGNGTGVLPRDCVPTTV